MYGFLGIRNNILWRLYVGKYIGVTGEIKSNQEANHEEKE